MIKKRLRSTVFLALIFVSTSVYAQDDSKRASDALRTWQQTNALGIEAYKAKKYKEAEKYYSQALQLDPKNSKVLNNYALLLFKLTRIEEALQVSTSAIQHTANKKEKANAYYNLGRSLEILARSDEALNAFKMANTLAPTSSRKQAYDRVRFAINTKKNAFTPKVLDDVSEILLQSPLSFADYEDKNRLALVKSIYEGLANNSGAITHVQPVVFGADKDNPLFREYETCWERSSGGGGRDVFEGMSSLGDYGFGLYREPFSGGGKKEELVFGRFPADSFRQYSSIKFVDLKACIMLTGGAVAQDIYPYWGYDLPIIAVNEIIQYKEKYYYFYLGSQIDGYYFQSRFVLSILSLDGGKFSLLGLASNGDSK